MSDYEDDFDDDDFDFDFGDYFYIEETYDEVGDLAEHAVASPPPFDDDLEEWDRFAYWNDIEYDSDGYHDVDAGTLTNRKRKRTQPTPVKGISERQASALQVHSPSKRRKGMSGTSHPVLDTIPDILITPVAWKEDGDDVKTPLREDHEEPFALLGDWRERFPDSWRSSSGEDETDKDASPQPLEIGHDAILAALRANLGKLTGGAGMSELGADEDMLMQHITQMLSQEGASLDDIAGGLADALFAPDNESVTSETLQEKSSDGEFGQWVMKKAEDNVGQAKPQQQVRELSPPAEDALNSSRNHGKTSPPSVADLPAERRPPTPAPTEGSINGSQKQFDESAATIAQPTEPRSRKRKATSQSQEAIDSAPSKRVATRSFEAPTASSIAKNVQAAQKPTSKSTARKAGKAIH